MGRFSWIPGPIIVSGYISVGFSPTVQAEQEPLSWIRGSSQPARLASRTKRTGRQACLLVSLRGRSGPTGMPEKYNEGYFLFYFFVICLFIVPCYMLHVSCYVFIVPCYMLIVSFLLTCFHFNTRHTRLTCLAYHFLAYYFLNP